MLKFTANYSCTDNNFVIQNLEDKKRIGEGEFLRSICVLQNILQRGLPTKMSYFLMDELKIDYKYINNESFRDFFGLISFEEPK